MMKNRQLPDVKKKEYRTPKIESYGTLQANTQKKIGGGADGAVGNQRRSQ
jgi:hypothetical protein